jgi:hypothetical protein
MVNEGCTPSGYVSFTGSGGHYTAFCNATTGDNNNYSIAFSNSNFDPNTATLATLTSSSTYECNIGESGYQNFSWNYNNGITTDFSWSYFFGGS